METNFDLRSLPENEPVLCIPRVYPNISEGRIRHIFDELNLGVIDHVDFVSKENDQGQNFNMVFIHFRYWKNNRNANEARERLLDGKQIKVIYDEPWFWKISAYKRPEPRRRNRDRDDTRPKKRPTLDLDFEDEEPRRPRREKVSNIKSRSNIIDRKEHRTSTRRNEENEERRKYERYERALEEEFGCEHRVSTRRNEENEERRKDEEYETALEEEFGFHNHQQDKDDKVEPIKEIDYGDVPAFPKVKKNKQKYIPRQVKAVQEKKQVEDSKSVEQV